MNKTLLESFRYGAWATKTLIDACRDLSVDQLERTARGFGSILATLNHIVLWDAQYVATLTGACPEWVAGGSETDDLDEIEVRVDETVRRRERFFAAPVDADRLLSLDEGEYECRAAVVVAQSLHHANAHREQVRTALRDLGVRPPDVQPWEYALETGRAHWRPEKKRPASGSPSSVAIEPLQPTGPAGHGPLRNGPRQPGSTVERQNR